MELSDATEKKTPATPGIDRGTFRLVAQCLNHYVTPGLKESRSHVYGCRNANFFKKGAYTKTCQSET